MSPPRRPLTLAESRDETRFAARTLAWGVGLWALARFLGVILSSASMAASVVQALAAEWGGGRLGVVWSDAHGELPSHGAIARRAAIGAALGLAAAGLIAGFAAVTGGSLIERVTGPVPWSLLGLGLITAGFVAMRDELILHGVVLRALTSVPSPVARALACGVTSGAAALGEAGVTPQRVVTAALLGTALGALWIRDRGAWMAWAANAALTFAVGTLLGGGAFELRVAATSWGGADGGLLGGTAAVLASAAIALVALALCRKIPRDVG